jgi:hypothetical protein
MQFGLLEAGPYFGLIAKLAIWFIGLSIFVMIYMIITMPSRYVQMRKRILSLAELILTQIRKGGWEASALTFSDTKDPQFAVYTEALRLELTGRGPIAIIESLNKTIDLVGRRFKQMIYYSRLLGWSVCFVGFIGALSHASYNLRAAAYLKDFPLGALAQGICESATLLEIALFIGLIWLAGSYFSQSRLSSLYLEVSDRVLKAAEERTTQDLTIEKV